MFRWGQPSLSGSLKSGFAAALKALFIIGTKLTVNNSTSMDIHAFLIIQPLLSEIISLKLFDNMKKGSHTLHIKSLNLV